MKNIIVTFTNYLEKIRLKSAKNKKDKANCQMKQIDIDLLESTWFKLTFLRNSEAFTLGQRKKINEAHRIIDKVYKQFDQFEMSKKYNWNLTADKHPGIENKENHINHLENIWLSLGGLRNFETFTLAQREKINEAHQTVVEVYKQFDRSKFWGDQFFNE